jgi:hypothetical protein
MKIYTVTILLLSLCKSQLVVRDVQGGTLPRICNRQRDVKCADLAREIFQRIQDSGEYMFDSEQLMGEVNRLGHSTRSCVRFQLYYLRRALYTSECVMDRLIDLNQLRPEWTELEPAVFREVASACKDDGFGASVCQIQNWYIHVFDERVGDPIEFQKMELKALRKDIPVWVAPASVSARLVGTEIKRLEEPVTRTMNHSVKRRKIAVEYEQMDTSSIEMDEEWMDLLLEEDIPADIVSPTTRIMPFGLIRPPVGSCSSMRTLKCSSDYIRAVRFMRWGITKGELIEVSQLLEMIGAKYLDSQYRCLRSAIRTFRQSLFVSREDLEIMLRLNHKNEEISPQVFAKTIQAESAFPDRTCGRHAWFFYVINRNRGKTLGDMNLTESTDAHGGPVFLPSFTDIEQLIDFELTRNVRYS